MSEDFFIRNAASNIKALRSLDRPSRRISPKVLSSSALICLTFAITALSRKLAHTAVDPELALAFITVAAPFVGWVVKDPARR